MHRNLIFTLALTLLLCGCSDEEGESSLTPTVDLDRPDEVTYKVDQWQSGVKLIKHADGAEHLKSSDAAAGELVFDKAAAAVAALTTDQVVAMEGVGPIKVISVSTSGDTVVVKAKHVPLTEVIKEGRLGWDQRLFSGKSKEMVGLGIGQKSVPLTGSYEGGKLTFTGTVSGWKVTFTLSPQGTGYAVTLSAVYAKNSSKITIKGKGVVTGLRSKGNIVISGGSLKDFTFLNEGLNGELDLEFGGYELAGEAKVVVPAKISLPFPVGFVPVTLSLGGSLEVQSMLKKSSASIARGKLRFSGSAGIKVAGGKISPAGKLDSASLSYTSGKGAGSVSAGLGVRMDFPRIELGMGLLSTGPECYLKVKSEVLSNYKIHYKSAGGVPVPTGTCLTAEVNLGGWVGGAFKLLGFTLASKEKLIFAKAGKKHQEGSACK